ncbi:MAG TPA: lipoprotein-releasing ABC transporter permease subunit [Burkholderiaceae bacterium]|jgi:lipoprotein-releasing system permease protein|nr:lipoprotein-releasing ABC transporter permease subunit [Burkholderiaceae bacterium]
MVNSPFELYVGLRYTRSGRRAGRRNGFISFISALSVAGIALGVAALITVLSVMNGFQKEVRDRMLSVLSHIEVMSVRESLPQWQDVIRQARAHPAVIGAAPYVSGQGMITHAGAVRGVLVRGADPALEPAVSELHAQMRVGQLDALVPGEFGVAVGHVLAQQLGVGRGDRITLIVPQGTVTPAGIVPRLRQFTIAGIFETGHYEYDSTLIVTHLEDAARLFRIDGASGVRLKTNDMMQAPRIARQLAQTLSGELLLRDWSTENRNWFAAVELEKRMMFIILTLIIAVAAFNLVSMLVMTVTDKQSDIAILRTLGAAPRSVMAIFVVQGAMIGLLGTAIGVALGVALGLNIGPVMAFLESVFGFQVLPQGIYFINYLPSDLRFADVAVIGGTSCVLALLATIYPSLRAARLRPAEALRYE